MSKNALLNKMLDYCGGNSEDPIYKAFCSVPREKFVPESDISFAYLDTPLPIGYRQTVSQPTMIYMMIKELDIQKSDKVLEIGTGSGYNAALMSYIAGEVHTIERIPELTRRAKETIRNLGISNVHFYQGDGTLGLPEQAPYDKIIVTAGAPNVPEELKEQMSIPAVLVIPVGDLYLQQLLKIVRKGPEEYQEITRGGCMFVKLIGKKGWAESNNDTD